MRRFYRNMSSSFSGRLGLPPTLGFSPAGLLVLFSCEVALFPPFLPGRRDFFVPCLQLLLRGLERESGVWVPDSGFGREEQGLWEGCGGLSCPGPRQAHQARVPVPGLPAPSAAGTRRGAQLQLSSWGWTQLAAWQGPPRVSMVTPLLLCPSGRPESAGDREMQE